MSNIVAMVVNVSVPNLEAAVPFYQSIADVDDIKRFSYKDLKLAHVGPFLLMEGSLADHIVQVATVIVRSVEDAEVAVCAGGGEILEGPETVPNGTRLLFKHPDGSIFEYIQLNPE